MATRSFLSRSCVLTPSRSHILVSASRVWLHSTFMLCQFNLFYHIIICWSCGFEFEQIYSRCFLSERKRGVFERACIKITRGMVFLTYLFFQIWRRLIKIVFIVYLVFPLLFTWHLFAGLQEVRVCRIKNIDSDYAQHDFNVVPPFIYVRTSLKNSHGSLDLN